MLFWRLTLKHLFSGNLTYELFFYLASLFVLCQWLGEPAVLRDVNVFQTKALLWFQHAKYKPSQWSLDATRETGITKPLASSKLSSEIGRQTMAQMTLNIYSLCCLIFYFQRWQHLLSCVVGTAAHMNDLKPPKPILRSPLNSNTQERWYSEQRCWYEAWGLHRAGVHHLNLLNKQGRTWQHTPTAQHRAGLTLQACVRASARKESTGLLRQTDRWKV